MNHVNVKHFLLAVVVNVVLMNLLYWIWETDSHQASLYHLLAMNPNSKIECQRTFVRINISAGSFLPIFDKLINYYTFDCGHYFSFEKNICLRWRSYFRINWIVHKRVGGTVWDGAIVVHLIFSSLCVFKCFLEILTSIWFWKKAYSANAGDRFSLSIAFMAFSLMHTLTLSCSLSITVFRL